MKAAPVPAVTPPAPEVALTPTTSTPVAPKPKPKISCLVSAIGGTVVALALFCAIGVVAMPRSRVIPISSSKIAAPLPTVVVALATPTNDSVAATMAAGQTIEVPPTAAIPPTTRPTRAATEIPPSSVPTQPSVPTVAPPTSILEPTAGPEPTQEAAPPPAQGPTFSNERVDPPWWPCEKGDIKGNNNSGIFHAPDQRDYSKTFKDVTCFKTEAEAEAAGFRKAKR